MTIGEPNKIGLARVVDQHQAGSRAVAVFASSSFARTGPLEDEEFQAVKQHKLVVSLHLAIALANFTGKWIGSIARSKRETTEAATAGAIGGILPRSRDVLTAPRDHLQIVGRLNNNFSCSSQ